jgi:hypothetical protein
MDTQNNRNNSSLDILLRIDTRQLETLLTKEKVDIADVLDISVMQVLNQHSELIMKLFKKLNHGS